MYPVGEADASGWLDVGDGHAIWWEAAGNPDGLPVLLLHGGPGSGFSASMRRWFDPTRFRTIGFDQRGAGRSRPSAAETLAALEHNKTAHLVADIEVLRRHLGVARWLVYGQSWGVTLGLCYAETYPERVAGAVFVGVTTTRAREIDWLYRGLAPLFPHEWRAFRAGVPEGTPETGMVAAYYRLLTDTDADVAERAARAFDAWDNASVSSGPRAYVPGDVRRMLGRGRIVTHYFHQRAWLEDGQLLREAGRLADIPGHLVQGRMDLQGPLVTAVELAEAWPGVRLTVVDGAGHSGTDIGMPAAILAAVEDVAGRVG
jgi:proline iminopeptidase